MAKALEETIKPCRRCDKKTVHQRSYNKTSPIMWLVHLVLTVVSVGTWLVILLIWLLLTKKIGGWTCRECGK